MRWLSKRNEFVHEPVCGLFQKHSPRTERSQSWHADQKECPDRLLPNADSEPDDVGLVNEVQPIGIEANKTEKLS